MPNEQLVNLDPKTDQRGVLPLAQASEGEFKDQGRTLFFTRLPIQRSSSKRYQGGTVKNLWCYTSGQAEAGRLTRELLCFYTAGHHAGTKQVKHP